MKMLAKESRLLVLLLGIVVALGLSLGAMTGCSQDDDKNSSNTSSTTSTSNDKSPSQGAGDNEQLDPQVFHNVANKDAAQAKAEYDGNVYHLSGFISKMGDDYIVLSQKVDDEYEYPIKVEFEDDDDMKGLSLDEAIVVVGTFEYENPPELSVLDDAMIFAD